MSFGSAPPSPFSPYFATIFRFPLTEVTFSCFGDKMSRAPESRTECPKPTTASPYYL